MPSSYTVAFDYDIEIGREVVLRDLKFQRCIEADFIRAAINIAKMILNTAIKKKFGKRAKFALRTRLQAKKMD